MYVCLHWGFVLVTSKFSGADIKSTNYNENTGIALFPDLASSTFSHFSVYCKQQEGG